MINYYVIDTSVLLFDPASITSFKDNHLVVPETVLKELDRKKNLNSVVGKHARTSIRTLKELSELGKKDGKTIIEGVKCSSHKGTVRIFSEDLNDIPKSLSKEDADNKILSVAVTLKKKYPKASVYLVTKDTSLELKAQVHNVQTDDYTTKTKVKYTGYIGYLKEEKPSKAMVAKLYQKGEIKVPAKYKEVIDENGFFWVESETGNSDVIAQRKGDTLTLCDDRHRLRAHNIKPLNTEQYFALSLLMDPNLSLVTLCGSAGCGKAQPLDSLVLTPEGFKNMGSVKKNDIVITPQGHKSKVLEVFPQGMKDVYQIEFSDGRKVECCKEHLWPIIGMEKGRDASKVNIITLEEFMKWRQEKPSRRKNRGRIPLVSFPVEYKEEHYNKFFIKPYTLGSLLGDGSFRHPTSVGFSSKDEYILEKIQHELPEEIKINKKAGDNYDYYVVDTKDKSTNRLLSCLKDLKLHRLYSHEKFIPDEYMNADLYSKLEIIRGLFDTEGSVSSTGQGVSFTTTSKLMAEQVRSILWELGAIVHMSIRETSFTHKGVKKKGRKSYRLNVRHPYKKLLFSLPRKLERLDTKDQYSSNLGLPITSITKVGKKECQCILIDDPAHLYITDNYVVTHNTLLALASALSQTEECSGTPYKKIMFARSLTPLGGKEQIGFLKGDLTDKLGPWVVPHLQDNMNQILRSPTDPTTGGDFNFVEYYTKHGILELCGLQYIRGRSLLNTILIIDECQNITRNEIYTIISRIGAGSKVILLGDTLQVDAPYLSRTDNALVHVIEAFKDSKIAGHLTLKKAVRSELAQEAAERLIF